MTSAAWGRNRALGPRCNLVRSRGKLRPFRAGYSSRPRHPSSSCSRSASRLWYSPSSAAKWGVFVTSRRAHGNVMTTADRDSTTKEEPLVGRVLWQRLVDAVLLASWDQLPSNSASKPKNDWFAPEADVNRPANVRNAW